MASSVMLTDIVSGEDFARIEESFRRQFGLGLESLGADGGRIAEMCSEGFAPEFCRLVRSVPAGRERCRHDCLRSLNISTETGQPYIAFCHAGIVHVCVPVMDGDTVLGGMLFGKCLWDKPCSEIHEDISRRLNGLGLSQRDITNSVNTLTVVPGRKIHQAAEYLFSLLYEVTGLDVCVMNWRRQRSQQQSEIGDVIQRNKKKPIERQYPYEAERKLIGKVRIGDRTGAREILNSLLGTIMFQNPGDMGILKARLVELLSILSRAAVEGGVEIKPLLEKNVAYINKVITLEDQEDICAWISNALNDFIESVYESRDATKMSQIKPAVDYIDASYDQPLTLADVAKVSYLSVSRMAHLFKEQMGVTIIDYLTSVRIGHARRLLLSTEKSCSKICFDVGYNNQSYFTRTFKEMTGLTPRQFREQNRRDNAGKHMLRQRIHEIPGSDNTADRVLLAE